MKKIFLSFGLIFAFALFATFSRRNVGVNMDRFLASDVSVFDNNRVITQTPVSTPDPIIPTPTVVTHAPMMTPKHMGQYNDGSYSGPVADAYYGNIQVRAVIRSGRLVDVVFLQYPNDRQTSIEINTQAMPYLKSEAIRAQSANVNIVSGASDSSRAFIESLGSALASAKN